MATRQTTTHLVAKLPSSFRRFEAQMGAQSKTVGAQLAQLRKARGWKGKDVVERMEALGDRTLNTNQLSRYERGGSMPGEERLSRFAKIFETTSAAIITGRATQDPPEAGDLMSSLTDAQDSPSLKSVEDRIVALRAELLAELAAIRKGQDDLRSQVERDSRSRADRRS